MLAPPVDFPELDICRINAPDRRGGISLLHFHYLIETPAGVEPIEGRHELALDSVARMLDCFRLARLTASHDPVGFSGHGLDMVRRLKTA